MGVANVINKTSAAVLRAVGQQQTDNGLLYVPPSIRIFGPPSNTGVVSRGTFREGLVIRSFEVHNRSGGAANVGIGYRTANRWWRAGRYDGTTFTDLTSSAQSTGTTTIQVTGADQTGWLILGLVPFDWTSLNITTAEVDAGGVAVPDHTVQYSTTGGVWTTFSTGAALTDNVTKTNAVWTVGATNFVWQAPSDWVVTDSHTGVPTGYYGMYLTSADREAGDGAAIITGMEIGVLRAVAQLANNAIYSSESEQYAIHEADGVVGYFSTANAGNRIYAEVTSI